MAVSSRPVARACSRLRPGGAMPRSTVTETLSPAAPVFMALNSVLSLGYYAPLVNLMYRKEPSQRVINGKPLTWTITLPLIVMALLVIVLGFMPGLLDWFTVPAARQFMQMFGS